MSSKFRIGILGSKGTTLDLISGLLASDRYKPVCVFTLRNDHKQRDNIAFYDGDRIRELCISHGIRLIEAKHYDLSHSDDLAAFAEQALDVLFVIGWERLVPSAVLDTLKVGGFGMHGSPNPLPRGRGRSPMNWSLITGERRFITNLFRYKPGVDNGDIVESQAFEINEHDDIQSLHHKNRAVMQSLLLKHLPAMEHGAVPVSAQSSGSPTFYPKRTPDDGGIDWSETTTEIHRLVRAVAPPYPGSFAFVGGRRVRINHVQPFDSALFPASIEAGTIVDLSPATESFVAKTQDGSILVSDFEGITMDELKVGMRLTGVNRANQYAELPLRYGKETPPAAWEFNPLKVK